MRANSGAALRERRDESVAPAWRGRYSNAPSSRHARACGVIVVARCRAFLKLD